MPQQPRRVLDLGCGTGDLGEAIKRRWPRCTVTGVDADAERLKRARQRLDEVLRIDLSSDPRLDGLSEAAPFDVIVCADVLEHLVRPERVLSRAASLLSSTGCMLVSLPNVRHYSTFVSLGLFGTWPRRERGIHDAAHLHFYARNDMLRLFARCGLRPVEERRNLRLIEAWSWTNIPGRLFDFWPLRPFLTFQYLHRLVPMDDQNGH